MDIRDKLITGSFMIGEDGRKEPPSWKDYALKLEAHFTPTSAKTDKEIEELAEEIYDGFESFVQGISVLKREDAIAAMTEIYKAKP